MPLLEDPVSAFGRILIANKTIDLETAKKPLLFCEVVIAPDFSEDALSLAGKKKESYFTCSKKH